VLASDKLPTDILKLTRMCLLWCVRMPQRASPVVIVTWSTTLQVADKGGVSLSWFLVTRVDFTNLTHVTSPCVRVQHLHTTTAAAAAVNDTQVTQRHPTIYCKHTCTVLRKRL